MRNGLVHVIAGLMVVVCGLGGGADCHAAVARQDGGGPGGAGGLLCDASERHVWFLVEAPATSGASSTSGYQLCHHAFDMNGPFYLPQATLPQQPVAIACWGDQVWMVLETGRDGAQRREVFTISVVKDVAFGRYHSVPRDRLDMAPPLPSDGELVSFVGGPEGPMAMVVRGEGEERARETTGVPRETASVAGDTSDPENEEGEKPLAPLSILQLRNNRWVEIASPADLPAISRDRALVEFSGADASTLNLLIQSQENQTLRYERIDGEWVKSDVSRAAQSSSGNGLSEVASDMHGSSGASSPPASLPAGAGISTTFDWDRLISLTHVAGQVAAIMSERGTNQTKIAAIRPSGLLQLATFAAPEGAWGVAGAKDTIYLVNRTALGGTQLRTIHPLTGAVSEPQTLAVQPISATRIWQSAVLLAATLIGLLLMFLIKPPGKNVVQLPKGIVVVPPMSRLLAFAIDAAPAAGLVVFALGKPLNEVLAMPITTLSFAQSGAYLMTFGVVWGHTALSEIFFGRSLGKALLDVRIVRFEGSKPTMMQLLARNLIKPLIFLVPPLAVVALFNHHMQGLHDLVAGTLVVHEEAKESE